MLVLKEFQLTVKLLGEARKVRSKTFQLLPDAAAVDDAAAHATALADVLAFIPTFAAVTDGEIVDWRLSTVFEEDAAVTVPADADLHREAYYSVGTNPAGTDLAGVSIPAPRPILYTGDDETTGTLDPADLALASFLDNFKPAARFRISDGETIQSVPEVRASRIRTVSS